MTDKELVEIVTHSARKAGARLEEHIRNREVQFIWHGPNGEVTPGNFYLDRQKALISACRALWHQRPGAASAPKCTA